ncbi:unnamed protein product, partial [Discosporangium mesarthrocarpum]
VIHALGHHNEHVPYRESTLTSLLRGSLGGGRCRTAFVVTLSPEVANLDETIATCR